MSKPLLAADFRVGAPGASYDIVRVAADPRVAPGLTADRGTIVEYVTTLGSVMLVKYADWDRAWRTPGEGPLYPKTSDEFLGATKLTPDALYLMDQMLGDVYDASGNGNTLTVVNTPSFQQTIEGKVGVWYDGALDAHAANVNDPAAGSFLFGAEGALISNPGGASLNNFIGRMDGAQAKGWMLEFAVTLNLLIRDAAGNIVVPGFVGSDVGLQVDPRRPYLCTGQVDRANGRIRGRMSRGGAVFSTIDIAIGTIGDVSFAGQLFGFGGINGIFDGGAWTPYGFYVEGAQTEGADVLRDLAVGLGWEI